MGLGTDALYLIGAVISSPAWGVRMLRTGKWRTDWRARFGRGAPLAADPRSTVLLHGVSVGEVASLAPLVEILERDHGEEVRLVVSATTDTGMERARALFGDRADVVRYPLDVSSSVGRFLDRVRPDVVALAELEIWPNFLEACRGRGIPVLVISGRLSDSSFGRYRKVRWWARPRFRQLHAVGAQTEEYAARFRELGAEPARVRVTDSTKWDAAPRTADSAAVAALFAALGIDRTRPLVVAGSTGPEEERMLLSEIPDDVQLLIAPRKPERFEEVAGLTDFVRRSSHPGPTVARPAGHHRFLLDTMGELETAYAGADVVVVGRSFVPLGGSDPIAPVALGRATVIGPHHDNFRDVVGALRDEGVLTVASRPGPAVRALLSDEQERTRLLRAGPAAVAARGGSARRNAELVLAALADRRSPGRRGEKDA